MSEQFEYENVLTGEKFLSDLSPVAISEIADEKDLDLEDFLSRITIDKKIKEFLYAAEKIVVKVKGVVIKLGKFLLNLISDVVATFKNAVKGAIIGAAIGFIFMQIPLIGWLLGPIALSTFAFVGSVLGLATDLVDLITNEEDRNLLKGLVLSRLQK